MISVAIIRAGYMGSAHARVLHRISGELPGEIELKYVVEVDLRGLKRVSAKYGGIPLSNIDDIPRDSVDLALIATLAVVIPPFTAISVIVYTVSSYFGNKYVRAVLSTLKAGVVGLIIVALCTTLRETYTGTSSIIPILILAAVTIYTVTAIAVFRIHPFYIILSLIPIGIILGAIGFV